MRIVTVQEMRALERSAIGSGIPEYRLMYRAGAGAARILEKWSSLHRLNRAVFFCGGGNNAGDALVAAALIRIPAAVVFFKDPASFKGAAAEAFRSLPPEIPRFNGIDGFDLLPGDFIVDALLGIGFSGQLREDMTAAMKIMKESRLPIVAFDLPSSLDGTTGTASAEAVPADLTITFGLPKVGLFLGRGPELSGKIEAVSIGLDDAFSGGKKEISFFTAADCRKLPLFPAFDAHKNSRGRVLSLSGSTIYPGAAALTAAGALHFSGLVRLLTVKAPYFPHLPAALICRFLSPSQAGCLPDDALSANPDFVSSSNVLCAGSGWSSGVSATLLAEVLDFPGPVVLDADGLNLLAAHPEIWKKRDDLIITPHPGEAARLAAGFGVKHTSDRSIFARRLAEKLHAVVVLKGFRTCVADPEGGVTLNGSGGPELACAGSGDVLCGMISGLKARGLSAVDAARSGVYIHGLAGDLGRGCAIADDLPALAAEALAGLL